MSGAYANVSHARTETVRWIHTDPSRVDGFRIYLRYEGEGYQTPSYDGFPLPVRGVFAVDFEVQDDRTVYFVATAYNDAESAFSNEIERLPPACGDGRVDPGERCDDGNLVGGDGCRSDCTVEACGDGLLDAGEVCDDGNLAVGDGCDARCRVEPEPSPSVLLSNPDFDDDLQLSGWSPEGSSPTWETPDVDDWPRSGSVRFANPADTAVGIRSACVLVEGGAAYDVSGWGYQPPPPRPGRLLVEVVWFEDPSCEPDSATDEVDVWADLAEGVWVLVEGSVLAPPNARGAVLRGMSAKEGSYDGALVTYVDSLTMVPEPGAWASVGAVLFALFAAHRRIG